MDISLFTKYAFLNVMMKNAYEFYTGQELSILAQQCENLLQPFTKLRHKWALLSLKSMIYTIRGLIDYNYCEMMTLLLQIESDIYIPATTSIFNFLTSFERLILSYIMRDLNQAHTDACTLRKLDQRSYHEIDTCMLFTLDCLARMSACPLHGLKRRSTLGIVRKRISILKKFASVNPQLCLGMLHLVQAKVAQNKGKISDATNLYISSISILDRENLLSILPLACEEMARYMMICNKVEDARSYFQESLELYQKWGAIQKVVVLQREINDLFIS
jgi:hypothetical protein